MLLCGLASFASAQTKAPKKHKLTDTVGVVNSEVITLYDFRNRLSAMIEEAAGSDSIKNGKVTPEQFTVFVDRTWDDFITDVIVEHEIDKRKLAVSDHAIDSLLMKHPPEDLRKNLTDSLGKFHPDYLQKILLDPAYDSIASVVRNAERFKFESARLIASVSNESDRQAHPKFDAWLKAQRKHLKVKDNRTAFGYY
jgi:hypothetical protein